MTTRYATYISKTIFTVICPKKKGTDQVLTKTRGLRTLYKRYNDAIDKGDLRASGRVEMEICIYIGAQQSRVESINHARSLGWPINIDFQGLHNRIAKMKDEIAKLLFVEGL